MQSDLSLLSVRHLVYLQNLNNVVIAASALVLSDFQQVTLPMETLKKLVQPYYSMVNLLWLNCGRSAQIWIIVSLYVRYKFLDYIMLNFCFGLFRYSYVIRTQKCSCKKLCYFRIIVRIQAKKTKLFFSFVLLIIQNPTCVHIIGKKQLLKISTGMGNAHRNEH